MTTNYIEHDDALGAMITWKDAEILLNIRTHRGTELEFIRRPRWGIACYMNGCIQSCELDETYYHAALVQPCFANYRTDHPLRTCIFGGGEGATARELLRHSNVALVDMYEWDVDVVKVFQTQCPQWARGAWNDPRLSIHIQDAFSYIQEIPSEKYDIIIIDLFEPEDQKPILWHKFLADIYLILQPNGSIGFYAGMHSIITHGKSQTILENILLNVGFTNIQLTKQFIPSYLGEACFLFATKTVTDPLAEMDLHPIMNKM